MLSDAFLNISLRVSLRYRTIRKLFNMQRLQAVTKRKETVLYGILFADDWALNAGSEKEMPSRVDNFAAACNNFGLLINIYPPSNLIASNKGPHNLMVPKSSEWENKTIITEFILLGLSNDPKTQNFLFFFFMIIYLVTVLGNIVIILVIKSEFHFQTPMFFFLSHLAFVDICYSSVTVPKMLANFITKQKTISWEGCIAQIFFFLQTSCTEVFILSAMGYDRYVAICDPLHYKRHLTKAKCNKMMGGAWFLGFLGAIGNVLPLLNLHFCSNNIIKHYNCELPSLLPLSCSETLTNYIALLIITLAYGFSSFLFTLVSYINIISSILKIKSSVSRQKAFSTCSSHLIVVSLFYITAFICYMKPSSESFMDLDKVISIQYSILTPMLNPIIYSLKNKQILCGLEKLFGKCRTIILTRNNIPSLICL
ncbi:olfactory receptor 5AR1-like [Erythrolamprus reginae]|uniref:olfactory receptor 5AR1-like n=1 Tax=Erythrolamprus reginae TaxID=121349 RepID=UPI00396CE8EB